MTKAYQKVLNKYGIKLNYIGEILVNGNGKIGKNVYHMSTKPGCAACGGTCFGTCPGCYGMSGNYNRYPKLQKMLEERTNIARNHIKFMVEEINREIKAHKIQYVRIHATGDFFNREYVNAWISIVKANPGTRFWTYTKSYGHGFDAALDDLNALPNCNIVKSIVPGCGFNFGHCDYILDTYYKLLSEGEKPYICRCGIDKNQHCNECHKCSECKYVLFIEHSTEYKAEKDPAYETLKKVIEDQE